jgi:RHS repeat-associated protein
VGATVAGTTSTYDYDGDGVRVPQATADTTTDFLWDREADLPLLVDDGTSASLHGDGLLAEIDADGTTRWPLADALGSLRGLTDATGSVTGTSDYAVFGATRTHTGTPSAFGFTGELTDIASGLVHLRARDLDPLTGRFLSTDIVQPNAPGTQG